MDLSEPVKLFRFEIGILDSLLGPLNASEDINITNFSNIFLSFS